MRKGIIWGTHTSARLYPLERALSRHLFPIYDKPLIYYPLCTLIATGIREILIVTTSEDQPFVQQLLGNGANWGLSIEYALSPPSQNLFQVLMIAAAFLGKSPCALIRSDSILHGHSLPDLMAKAAECATGCTVFASSLGRGQFYERSQIGTQSRSQSICETGRNLELGIELAGLYLFDSTVVERAKRAVNTVGGQLHDVDLTLSYLVSGELRIEHIGRGCAWLDTTTEASILEAALYVKAIEDRQGVKIGCPEETAWRMGFITTEDLERCAVPLCNSGYGGYLLRQIEYSGLSQ